MSIVERAVQEERERCIRLIVRQASYSTHPGQALCLAALIAGGEEACRAMAATAGMGWGGAIVVLERYCTSRFSYDQFEEMGKSFGITR